MADVDFASQLLQASNARVQKRFDEQAATNAKLRDALLAKINETDPYGNPVLDAQGVSDALDQVKKIHMNGIGDLINTAKDALGKVHGLISAPPQVRQKVHDHVMNVVSKLNEGQQGEAADTTPVTQAAGLTPPPTMTGGAGSAGAGGAGGAGAPPIPKTATTTPSEEAAAALPPPPTPTALVPAPPQTPATPAPATGAPAPSPAAPPRSRLAREASSPPAAPTHHCCCR